MYLSVSLYVRLSVCLCLRLLLPLCLLLPSSYVAIGTFVALFGNWSVGVGCDGVAICVQFDKRHNLRRHGHSVSHWQNFMERRCIEWLFVGREHSLCLVLCTDIGRNHGLAYWSVRWKRVIHVMLNPSPLSLSTWVCVRLGLSVSSILYLWKAVRVFLLFHFLILEHVVLSNVAFADCSLLCFIPFRSVAFPFLYCLSCLFPCHPRHHSSLHSNLSLLNLALIPPCTFVIIHISIMDLNLTIILALSATVFVSPCDCLYICVCPLSECRSSWKLPHAMSRYNSL